MSCENRKKHRRKGKSLFSSAFRFFQLVGQGPDVSRKRAPKHPANEYVCGVFWSWKRDLNTRPADYESAALPTELFQRIRNVWALSGMTGSGGRADGAHGIKHNFAALRYVLKYYTQKTGVRQEENADLSKLSDFENSSRSFFSPHRAPFPGILTENKYSNGKKCSMIGGGRSETIARKQGKR